MGELSELEMMNFAMSECSLCQAEFFYDGVAYFVASDNGGPDESVCRSCFDKTLGR